MKTAALFLEAPGEKGADVKFSLHNDVEGLINARRSFVHEGDPTGYAWALKYLDSYRHFERLLESTWFKEAFDQWVRELNMKNRADAIQKIKQIADEGNDTQALQASKYLAEAGWDKQAARGRPSKEELKGELKRLANLSEQTNEDLERIGGLKLIKGGK
jgi:hypothetical protein